MDSAPSRLQPSQVAQKVSPYHGLLARARAQVIRNAVGSLTAATLRKFVFAPPYRCFQNQRSRGLALIRFHHRMRVLL
jgi:hypothetical protein